MPELPEVEVVRLGLDRLITASTVSAVEVRDGRALKRHRTAIELATGSALGHGATLPPSVQRARAEDLERRLVGQVLGPAERRGKFLWLPLLGDGQSASMSEVYPEGDGGVPTQALQVHLGMSGQMLVRSADAPDDGHVRIRAWLESPAHGEVRLDFVDQRLFGSWSIDTLAPDPWGVRERVPTTSVHIAPDPLEPGFVRDGVARRMRLSNSAIKQVLLDQHIVSGIGNIYADEALWEARVHPATPASRVSVVKTRRLLDAAAAVMRRALVEGGTSFDAQYVNVNGESGYFSRSLRAYGRQGLPCLRCEQNMRRIVLGGRSSHFCSRCQRLR